MKGKGGRSGRANMRQALRSMRLNIIAFVVLVILAAAGMFLIRSMLLKNSRDTGMALAQNFASEEQSNLTVYETLISFGTTSIDRRIADGNSWEELSEWLSVYFERLNTVLGEGVVDPYVVIDGKILAANPWEGDDAYDVSGTEWYQKAMAAQGKVIFTDAYTDAIYKKPVITVAQKCQNTDAIMAFDIFPQNIKLGFDSMELSEEDSFFLCDSTGKVLYRQTSLECSEEELQEYLSGLIHQIDGGLLESSGSNVLDLEGKQRAVYYARMDNGWFSILTIPYSSILGDFNWFTLIFGLIFLLFLAVLAGMVWRDVKINDRIRRTNETVRVLGNSYYALYRIDFGQDTYEMIKGSDYVRSRIAPTGQYEELLKVAGEVIEEDAYKEFLESFSSQNIRRLVSQRIRNFGGDFRRRFGDEMRWVSVRILFDESLAPEEVVLCFREVEEEKQRQLQERRILEDALEIAKKNEAAKQSFFSNMSHDMRTPLNAIIGLSDLAGQHIEDPEKVAQYLRKIHSSSRQLLSLINDILDMSRMEQGKVTLNNKEFNLRECVEECMESFHFAAEGEHKSFKLEFHVKNERLLGDPFRIQQILNNLLSNAFKFTDKGDEVTVSVTQLNQGDHEKYKFVVADTGIGMSEDFLPHLFEPYSREMRFSAKQAAGTGLGMPITKNLVALMDGEMYVESEAGKGSTFTVILPLAVVQEDVSSDQLPSEVATQEKKEEKKFSLEECRILLAEDNEVNMEIADEILSMNGMQVTRAWNGVEAVEKFRSSKPFSFDAILMDMQMPEMDGCEASRRIRAMRRPDAKSVPIIAVTANAFAEDITATAAAGMNAHVSKPIDFSLLCKLLEKWIHKGGTDGEDKA